MASNLINKSDYYISSNCNLLYLKDNNSDLSKRYFEFIQSSNDTELQFRYAMIYYVNDIDHNKAFELFRINSRLLHLNSIFMLSICYLYGKGVQQNTDKGLGNMIYLANIDYIDAQIFIGKCCMTGYFVSKNQYDAIYWWKMAADQGNLEALTLIEENGLWDYHLVKY